MTQHPTITSSVDWCEPNYIYPDTFILKHVAEQFNTWSALLYLLFAILYLYNGIRLQRQSVIDYVRPRFWINSMGLLAVGIGTFLFHATLTREHQILDELSMNFAIVLNVYIFVNHARTEEQERRDEESVKKHGWLLGGNWTQKISFLGTCSLMILIMALYDQMNPLRFRVVFGLTALSLGIYCVYMSQYHSPAIQKILTPEESKNYTKEKTRFLIGTVLNAALGFGLWLVERQFCFEPLKLHSWWHYFTGLGAYCAMMYTMYAFYFDRDVYMGKSNKDRVYVKWYCFGMYPWIHGTPMPDVAGRAAAEKQQKERSSIAAKKD